MPPQLRKRAHVSEVSRSSRNAPKKINLSQAPQIPTSELILHPDAEKIVCLIREKYGEPVSILPVDEEELFCICLDVESKYAGGMVECTNASKCLARWFHLWCIGMTVPPDEDDDWFCTRCIQRRIGKAGDWFDKLHYTSGRQLQNTILGKSSNTPADLSNVKSNNPFSYRSKNTAPPTIAHETVPVAFDLAIRGAPGNTCPAPEGFPDCKDDLVMGDAVDSPGNASLSKGTEVLEITRIIQEQMAVVAHRGIRTDRTPVVRRETSTTKKHTSLETKDTDKSMSSAESVSGVEYGNDYSAYTDPIEFYEDLSDGYLGEESDVSMSDDS
ncbi:hypothetical protein MMC17_000912 [Xylographa soralifera]|nr:hypothetical protein [Xylographa soralifera]